MFKRIPFFLIFVVMMSCGSGNSPENVVTNYIKGVQNFDARLAWENSKFDYFDKNLLKEEKEKKFQDYKKEFDKKEYDIFKLFPTNAEFKIFSVDKHDAGNDVFVEVNYPLDTPFEVNQFKTAKKLKVTLRVRNKNDHNYVDDFDWNAVEYNKQYDNKVISDFVKMNRDKDLKLCYEKCKSALNHDEEYFNDIKALFDDLNKKLATEEVGIHDLIDRLAELEKKKKELFMAALDKADELEEAQDEYEETRQESKKNELKKKIDQLKVEAEKEKQKVRDLVTEIGELKKKIEKKKQEIK